MHISSWELAPGVSCPVSEIELMRQDVDCFSFQQVAVVTRRRNAQLSTVNGALLADLAQVAQIGGRDLAAPAPATGETEAEQGAIAQAVEGVIAGCQHGFQLRARDGGLLGRSLAAFDRGAPGAAE